MKSTDAFELSPSSEEYKQSILAKIDGDLEDIKNQLENRHESRMSPNESRKLKGKQYGLEQLKVEINAIKEPSRQLGDPNSRLLNPKRFLSTDDKFLNAAYSKAKMIRDHPPLKSRYAPSKEGKIGNREAMSEIMAYIESR